MNNIIKYNLPIVILYENENMINYKFIYNLPIVICFCDNGAP